MTARASSTRSSRVGTTELRSDIPVPRLSKCTTRANRPTRSNIDEYSGRSHISSMFWANGGIASMSIRPLPYTW